MSDYNFDGYKWHRFWLKSNRGTDTSTYKFLPGDFDDDDIKEAIEEWCSNSAAWHQSMCEYGAESLDKLPPDVLARKIERLKERMQQDRALLNEYEKQQLQEIPDKLG